MRISYSKKSVSFFLICAVLAPVVWKSTFGWHRPYMNWSPRELAEYLAEKNRPAEECMDLIYFEIMAPSQAEQRAECVYRYAKLTKDPSACELLMPSSYGWSCLGGAQKANARLCWFDFSKAPYSEDSPVMPECGSGIEEYNEQCCQMAQHLYMNQYNSCEVFMGSQILYDQCQELLARREIDIKLCQDISSTHVRTACEVAVRSLLKKQ